MGEGLSALEVLRERLISGAETPAEVMVEAQMWADQGAAELAAAAGEGVHPGGTYLWRDAEAAVRYAETLPERFPVAASRPLLYGVPVSVKDCFDLAGTVTSCGSRFYAELHAPATENAWIVDRLLAAGAVVTGKTHLHQLAYGITGENEEYGDCLQPRDRGLLTGGSSSGAVASVQEGSAMVAVGTDTGGSVRVPAALCGMAGYRASHGLFPEEVCWKGGAHLAQSFDTLGLLFSDLRDGPVLGSAVFGLERAAAPSGVRIGFVGDEFLTDCEADVMAAYAAWKLRFEACGVALEQFETEFWGESKEIFTTIQASEAAALHRGYFDRFEKTIGERLAWGASLTANEIAGMHRRHKAFCARMTELFDRHDFLVLPCAPVSRLVAGEDQSGARARILRYTSPISLAGLPTVTLPGEAVGDHFGTGVQLVGKKGRDAELLAFAAAI
jgi:Asp-tRNA(Asn)/Glu-tRNA(Gln) amidotransferase A subunit family amidase